MTPYWLFQAPEIRKSLFGVLRDLKLTFLGVFRPLKWHLFSYFRFLKWGKAFLEFQGALNDYIFAFSGAWKDTLLAEKGDILISYWNDLVISNRKDSPNPIICTCIWAVPPSHCKNLLQLVKIQILEPSGRVLPWWLQICPSGFKIFRSVSAEIWKNIFETWHVDGSRSHQSKGLPKIHDFWAAPGAIWSHQDGSAKKTNINIWKYDPWPRHS